MGSIVGAFILPHPPIMIHDIGKAESEKVRNTINAAEEVGNRVKALKPDTVIVITPHGTIFSDAVSVSMEHNLKGSFKNFGAPQISLEYENDMELLYEILVESNEANVACAPLTEDIRRNHRISPELDHGALVPLYFINQKYSDFKLIHIVYSMLPHEAHYKFGMALQRAIHSSEKKVVIIASGDLSHRLSHDSYNGYNKCGPEFDNIYIDCIKSADIKKLMTLKNSFLEKAGECGYRSSIILFGALDKCNIRGDLLSYEGPFGVGYCVAELKFEDIDNDNSKTSLVLNEYLEYKRSNMKNRRKAEDPYVSLARNTLETYIRTGKLPEPPDSLPEDMLTQKAGVFVSIKKNDELRGCIGTIAPTTESIADEIINNAISAGTKDPRFYPIEEDELDELVYSVDILMPPESITDKSELDTEKYGVIVKRGYKTGLLLPNLEGVDTVEEQISIALQKAGISSNEKYSMERFEVIRHT